MHRLKIGLITPCPSLMQLNAPTLLRQIPSRENASKYRELRMPRLYNSLEWYNEYITTDYDRCAPVAALSVLGHASVHGENDNSLHTLC